MLCGDDLRSKFYVRPTYRRVIGLHEAVAHADEGGRINVLIDSLGYSDATDSTHRQLVLLSDLPA